MKKEVVLKKIFLYILAIIFCYLIWLFIRFAHKKLHTNTMLNIFATNDMKYLYYNNLPGKIKQIIKEKKERRVEIIKHAPQSIKIKDEEIIIKKNDTLTNVVGPYYGKYNDSIVEAIKKANPGIDITQLSVGQKLILPYIADIQKESGSEQIIEKKIVEKKIILNSVEIENVNAYYNDRWIFLEGEVYNNSDKEINFLKINVDFLNKKDKLVTSNFTYIVKEKGLKRKEKKSFYIMTKYTSEIRQYEIWLEYY